MNTFEAFLCRKILFFALQFVIHSVLDKAVHVIQPNMLASICYCNFDFCYVQWSSYSYFFNADTTKLSLISV